MIINNYLERIKKIVNIVFVLCFLLLLVVPVAKINRANNQVSEIDNRMLEERPIRKIGTGFIKGQNSYLDDRIGFRTSMIFAYQKIFDVFFKKLVHPIYMYGEEGHIFIKGRYIIDYQHLNINDAFINKCGAYLNRIYKYLSDRNIKFIYFLAPDKKSIYSEFMPRTMNVNGDKSQAMRLIDKVKLHKIPYIYPIKEFLEAKRHEQIFNRKYDAGHWNQHGAFIGHSLITKKLQEYFPDVKSLSKSNFKIEMRKVTSLPVSQFEIDENVPHYLPKMKKITKNIRNKAVTRKPQILIFHDSYFCELSKYYGDNFSEIRSIHQRDISNIEYYINIHEPDVVLLENAERTIIRDRFLFSERKMKETILHDYSDLNLPTTANKTNISIILTESAITVPAAGLLSTITGTVVYLFDGKPGKALFAKVNDKHYVAQYPSVKTGEKSTFSLTLKVDTLKKANKIEFYTNLIRW